MCCRYERSVFNSEEFLGLGATCNCYKQPVLLVHCVEEISLGITYHFAMITSQQIDANRAS